MTIDEILRKYIYYDAIEHVDTDDEKNDRYTEEMIAEAKQSILSALLAGAPEDKEVVSTMKFVQEERKFLIDNIEVSYGAFRDRLGYEGQRIQENIIHNQSNSQWREHLKKELG
jgi:hypothetical protein